MKLFFKHLLRSTAKKPLQPILLVITLTLAVMSAVFSFSLGNAIERETLSAQQKTYGSAHVTVTLDETSASRFMFVRDAERILGGSAEVAGSFDLPLTMGEEKKAVSAVAVDFSQIERIFSFSFTQYGVLTESAIPSSAFVTERFARENGLFCGSSFTVTALGQTRSYTVVGISETPLVGTSDVVVDIRGVARLIGGDSLLLSSMKDGFRPCNVIYIEVLSGTVEDCIAKLSQNSVFAQNTVTDVSKAIANQAYMKALSAILNIAIALTFILSAAVAFCCLYILSYERTVENRGFMLSGMRARHLHLFQYAEVLVHWIFGSALGTLLAALLMRALLSKSFRYVTVALRPWDAVKGILAILAAAMLTVLIFIFSDRLRGLARPRKLPTWLFLLPLVLTAVSMLLALVLPVRVRFSLYVPFVVLTALSVFWYAAPLLCELARRSITRFETQLQETGRVRSYSLYYAVKNILSVKILQNTARLVAVLAFVVFSVGAIMISAVGNIRAVKTVFTTDYVVLGATEKCYQGVQACDAVQTVRRLYMQNGTDETGASILLLSSNEKQALSEHMRPEKMPKGNRVAISRGEARARSLRVGDRFKVNAGGKDLTLVVDEILDVGMNCVILDAKHFGLHYNLLAVEGKQSASDGALFEQLSAKTATEMATLMRTEDLWREHLSRTEIYLDAGRVILLVISALALIGMADNLGQGYRARREEFRLYRLSGMSAAQVRKMKLTEIFSVIFFGIALALLASIVFLLVTNVALRTHSFETFSNIRHYFRIK